MPKSRELTPNERSEIIGARLNRVPLKEISRNMNIPYSTVKYTWSKREEREQVDQRSLRRSAPRKTTDDQDNRLYRQLRRHPTTSYKDIKDITPLGRRQTLRRVKDFGGGFGHYKAKWRPLITAANAQKRLAWAREHENDPPTQWQRTWFTDECSIELGSGQKRPWVWRHSGEQWLPEMIAQRPPRGVTVMIWAALRADGRIKLVFCDDYLVGDNEKITSNVYVSMLEDIIPELYEPGDLWIQDNAPIHNARVVKDWLENHGVWTAEWPPYSPDLNVIEHLWWPLKAKVYELYPELATIGGGVATKKHALKRAIRAAFEALTSNPEWDLPRILVDSMQRRIQAVIYAQGQNTKY